MKKITLLIAGILLGASSLFAQSLEIIWPYGNHSLNDSTIIVNGALPTLLYTEAFQVINVTGGTVNAKVKRIDEIVAAHSGNYLCWGNCYNASTSPIFTSPIAETIGAHDTDQTFTADLNDTNNSGSSKFRYVFYNTANANDTASITIIFNVSPLGVNSITDNVMHFSAPYPNPAGNNVSFTYTLNNIQQAEMEVYNTIGQCVETVPVNASSNKLNINVGGFPSGIYICKFSANGAEPVYQKLIVTH